MEQDVRMRLDQAGQQGGARQFDHCAAPIREARHRAHGLDPGAPHEHRPAIAHRLAVEHTRWFEEPDRFGRRRADTSALRGWRQRRGGGGRHNEGKTCSGGE